MLVVERDVPLAPKTTLGIGGAAKQLVRVTSLGELPEALALSPDILVLGGGSNLVIGDAGFAGTVLEIALRGTAIDRDSVSVAAGVAWDDFVAQMVEAGRAGVECLSGIPGLVGATPMQNVGAYGQEVADTIVSVRAYDRERGELVTMTRDDCRFAYRSSVFRGSARWIIVDVTFRLPRATASAPIRYAELQKALGTERAPLHHVRDTVIELRRGKGMVVDPADPESRSAGSFFTNPIVAPELAPAGAPSWPQPDGRVKLAAAWLIERAGFAKGHTHGRVGISNKHALALVNRGGATAHELLELARLIQDAVLARHGIALALEPIVV
ncbi:MAG TPA: UDP-N-acetylmuramate dehydrogenase [Kofleriaceae bacterium]|jgi:UDP-N-acetylmuramate dehydrogenase